MKPVLLYFTGCVVLAASFFSLPPMPVAGGVKKDKSTTGKVLPSSGSSKKHGVGLAESHGLGAKQLEELHVAWFYNWGPETKLKTHVPFVPMIFSTKSLNAKISGEFVLGYNEPDNSKQSNISVKEALATWPKLAAHAKHVGAPAMAGNPITGDWLPAFMHAKPKVDFITVHWYKGADAKHFIKDIQEIHTKYNKPIWVTEFAPQTADSSRKEPTKFTQAQVNQFVAETTHWMETTAFVERYAWHDSKVGTSALFNEKGGLTATGKAYAALHASK